MSNLQLPPLFSQVSQERTLSLSHDNKHFTIDEVEEFINEDEIGFYLRECILLSVNQVIIRNNNVKASCSIKIMSITRNEVIFINPIGNKVTANVENFEVEVFNLIKNLNYKLHISLPSKSENIQNQF
jgi:hypothetical protein